MGCAVSDAPDGNGNNYEASRPSLPEGKGAAGSAGTWVRVRARAGADPRDQGRRRPLHWECQDLKKMGQHESNQFHVPNRARTCICTYSIYILLVASLISLKMTYLR